MRDNLYTVVYSAVLGIVCAGLLTGAGQLTAERIEKNEAAEKYRNVLNALGVSYDEDSSSEDVVALFKEKVQEGEPSEAGESDYRLTGADGKLEAVAVGFAGQGLWGPVKGFLALEADMKTIRGVTFYEQQETPGLGGEIGKPWFTDQFKGKVISNGEPGMHIRRDATGNNEVDAISGATMTCQKVEAMLNTLIARIVEEENNAQ